MAGQKYGEEPVCNNYESTPSFRTVLVYDLGGGTFDVSIVRSMGLGEEVLSTAGVTDLGGEDFDRRLFEHATAEFKSRGLLDLD